MERVMLAKPSSFSMLLRKEPHLARRNRIFTQIASITVILLGGLVLTGWQVQIQGFRSILPTLVSMDPNAAAGMLLCGAALSLLSQEGAEKAGRFFGIGPGGDCPRASDLKRMFFWSKVGAGG